MLPWSMYRDYFTLTKCPLVVTPRFRRRNAGTETDSICYEIVLCTTFIRLHNKIGIFYCRRVTKTRSRGGEGCSNVTQITAQPNAKCHVKVTVRRGPSQLDGEHCEMTADRLSDDWMTRDNLEERIHPSVIRSAVPYLI